MNTEYKYNAIEICHNDWSRFIVRLETIPAIDFASMGATEAVHVAKIQQYVHLERDLTENECTDLFNWAFSYGKAGFKEGNLKITFAQGLTLETINRFIESQLREDEQEEAKSLQVFNI